VDRYEEYQFCTQFGVSPEVYAEMPAHTADTWLAFRRMDDEIDAELQRRADAQNAR
jgi:hypothetical protein